MKKENKMAIHLQPLPLFVLIHLTEMTFLSLSQQASAKLAMLYQLLASCSRDSLQTAESSWATQLPFIVSKRLLLYF